MSDYGKAAHRAVQLYTTGLADSPQDAWAQATTEIFGSDTPSQSKGCPKCAFLGLCEEGLVKGIPGGNYTRSVKNKGYAVDAVAILKRHTMFAESAADLWDVVMKGESKEHNHQMDVVISLWENGLLVAESNAS